MSRLGGLQAQIDEIKDSRSQPTIRVRLNLGDAEGVGDVPAGWLTNEEEAQRVPVAKAIEQIKTILLPLIRKSDADLRRHDSLVEIENAIVKEAGAQNDTIGANAVMPVSRALWQLAAALRDLSLCEYLRRYEPALAAQDRVHFFMNVFHGGKKALREGEKLGRDRIDIQDIMVVPVGALNYREALAMGDRIDATLGEILTRAYGADRVSRGDEAGFTVAGMGDSGTAIVHVLEAVERSGYIPGGEVKLALDVAASSLFDPASKSYRFAGATLQTEQMIAFLAELAQQLGGKLIAVEDGLDLNDWDGWGELSARMAKQDVLTVGDDLFVTQMRRLRRGVNNQSAHAILVKVSQNGSLRGTLDVMQYARENGIRCLVSHRAGETLDESIADLAVATGAFGLKAGAPQPPSDFSDPTSCVRRCKYQRTILLEETGR